MPIFNTTQLNDITEKLIESIERGHGWISKDYIETTIRHSVECELPQWQIEYIKAKITEASLVHTPTPEPSQMQYDFEGLKKEMIKQKNLANEWIVHMKNDINEIYMSSSISGTEDMEIALEEIIDNLGSIINTLDN